MPAKSIFRSKTFWVNAAAAVGLIGQWAVGHHWIAPGDAAFALAIANIGLRIITEQPVTLPGSGHNG